MKIILVDDHPIVCYGLTLLINHEPDLEVCGEARDIPEALCIIEKTKPDIAVVDISLGNMSGLVLTETIRERYPDVRVLILSMYEESLYAERVLRAGAAGYVMKSEATEKLVKVIRQILNAEIYVSRVVASRLLKLFYSNKLKKGTFFFDNLSDRELEVFQLISCGFRTRDIAEKLQLSPNTIETYLGKIRQKLNLENNRELIRHAIA